MTEKEFYQKVKASFKEPGFPETWSAGEYVSEVYVPGPNGSLYNCAVMFKSGAAAPWSFLAEDERVVTTADSCPALAEKVGRWIAARGRGGKKNPLKKTHLKRAKRQGTLAKSAKTVRAKAYHLGAKDAHLGKKRANPPLTLKTFYARVKKTAPDWVKKGLASAPEALLGGGFAVGVDPERGNSFYVDYVPGKPKNERWRITRAGRPLWVGSSCAELFKERMANRNPRKNPLGAEAKFKALVTKHFRTPSHVSVSRSGSSAEFRIEHDHYIVEHQPWSSAPWVVVHEDTHEVLASGSTLAICAKRFWAL